MAPLVIIVAVFGLTVLLILRGYTPAATTAAVATTSVATSELIRHVREVQPARQKKVTRKGKADR